jgi:hypothetical protein
MLRIVIAVAVLGITSLAAPIVQAQVTATNGILTVSMTDSGAEAGQFTITTGASHPQPDQQVLFPIGTSYITLRDSTASEIWANAGGSLSGNLGGFTFHSMQAAPATAVVTTIAGGFRATYTLPNWTVVQDVVIVGTTLADTAVRQSVTVTNTSGVSRQYGLRYMWDWDIADNDDSIFRTRNPDGSFTSTFIAFQPPGFQAFEEQAPSAATFSIFGTVQGGSLSPPPTPPDRFGYVSWSDAEDSPWDFPVTGGNDDSGTVHYWGFVTPITLAAGGSNAYNEYISTVPSAVGIGPPAANLPVPTLSETMLMLLVVLLMGAATYGMRRRA